MSRSVRFYLLTGVLVLTMATQLHELKVEVPPPASEN